MQARSPRDWLAHKIPDVLNTSVIANFQEMARAVRHYICMVSLLAARERRAVALISVENGETSKPRENDVVSAVRPVSRPIGGRALRTACIW